MFQTGRHVNVSLLSTDITEGDETIIVTCKTSFNMARTCHVGCEAWRLVWEVWLTKKKKKKRNCIATDEKRAKIGLWLKHEVRLLCFLREKKEEKKKLNLRWLQLRRGRVSTRKSVGSSAGRCFSDEHCGRWKTSGWTRCRTTPPPLRDVPPNRKTRHLWKSQQQ